MKCTKGDTRFQPKSSTPRNPLSSAKAKMPSAAKALPNTSPTYLEYTAQLVPNSNSMTMPVATPMPKVSAKILVQKRASVWYCWSPVRRYKPSSTTITKPRPMLSGG